MLLFALVSCASAFPLVYYPDGVTKISINGVIRPSPSEILLDVSSPQPLSLQLVDSDDKFYWGNPGEDIDDGRFIYGFSNLPEDIVIKRVRAVSNSPVIKPFTIEWEGVPHVSNSEIDMMFYGTSNPEWMSSRSTTGWLFDVKLKNLKDDFCTIQTWKFGVIDQFGWEYHCKDTDVIEMMPNESMRFDVKMVMSAVSRPVYLTYGNLTMDISAWV